MLLLVHIKFSEGRMQFGIYNWNYHLQVEYSVLINLGTS